MNKFYRMLISLCLLGCATGPAIAQEPETKQEIHELRDQIAAIQQQLHSMQARLAEIESESATGDDAIAGSQSAPDADANVELVDSREDQAASNLDELDQRIATLETVADDWASAIQFGGAVRLNYAWRDYDEDNKDRVGDFELELFRINADGNVGGVKLSAEWRRYNDFQAIHHAWFGYEFSDELEMQLGISQVPFGILPFASHSFWFGGTYYLGFEDDYDAGVQLIHKPNDDWTFHYAFFKNPEYASDSRFGRYSFDLVTSGDQQNSEINQFNLRAERHLKIADLGTVDAGVSLQGGQIFNSTTQRKGDRYAVAGHANANFGRWNLQLQGIHYEFEPENPVGVDNGFVQTGAFDFPFLMAAKGDVYSVNIARSFDAALGPISGGTCYNDFTFIDPKVRNSADSIQNVTGCSIVAGGLFAYFDWITGKNMWFAGGDGIGLNAATAGKWRSRLNVNFGFYF